MDEDNKTENDKPQQEYVNEDGSRPHVSVFGMDMDKGSDTANSTSSTNANANTNTNANATASGNATKDDWRRQKEEWRAERRAQRDAWRAERRNNWNGPGHHHDGGFFWGVIILFLGVIALLYTLGYISHMFWYAILPFWPILLILWGMGIILGRHWSARIILFIITIAFLVAVVIYGLVKVDSPLVNNLPPNVTNSINAMQPMQPAQY